MDLSISPVPPDLLKKDSQGFKPESPFWLRDLTGLTRADGKHNPRVGKDGSRLWFHGDLSGLRLYRVKSMNG
jgi:hypothetical protein